MILANGACNLNKTGSTSGTSTYILLYIKSYRINRAYSWNATLLKEVYFILKQTQVKETEKFTLIVGTDHTRF